MGEISKSTPKAFAWLGFEEDDSNDACDFLLLVDLEVPALYRRYLQLNPECMVWPDNPDGTPDPRNLVALSLSQQTYVRQAARLDEIQLQPTRSTS